MPQTYDLIVIGAGPGGYTAAISAAQHGLNVALAEARQTGGTCLNRGCIPAKTLLHAAGLYQELRHSEDLGVIAGDIGYDIAGMYRRKDEVVAGLREGVEALLKANEVTLFFGAAKILSPKTVLVNGPQQNVILEAAKILIATGSVPVRPPIVGIDLPGVMTSDELLAGSAVDYKSLVIIGGGVIGMEFASLFSALERSVTVVEATGRILPTLDREVAQNLSMILKKRGVTIHTGCSVERISQRGGELCCHFSEKDNAQEVTAAGVLVAVGRKANTDALFSDGICIRQQRGIMVDAHYETSEKGIYAIGDAVAGGIQLAHAAAAQALNAVAEMVGEQPPVNLEVIPGCVFTSPEIASVGINVQQAKERGIAVKTGKYGMSGNGKTVIERQDRSFIKLVFDAKSEVLLGAQLMCARASDLVSEFTAAIVNKLTLQQLAAVIRPHPTFSEAATEALEDVTQRAIHILPKKK